MPEQNQPIQGNFGDIYKVETPTIDRVTQQLQAQYAARQAFQQKEALNTSELLNKEMANVRSVDAPEVIDAYNKWKGLSQNMLFNKALQANPKAYNAAQMEANAAYANAMSLVTRSTQYNQLGKTIAANRLTKPDMYDDKAGEKLSTFYQTPMDKLTNADYGGQKVDLTNPDNYRYQGGNVDFSKIHAVAAGKPVTHYDDGTTDESGVQTTQHGYSYGNTPTAYRNTYLGGLAGNEANRGARFNWSQRTQPELDQLDAAYQNSPNWQKLGMQPQPLPPYNPNDPVGNEATYQAKQYLVGMNPAEVKAATTINQATKIDLQTKDRLKASEVMEALRENDREKLTAIRHQYKQADVKEQSQVLDNLTTGMLDDAMKSGTYTYKSANGNVSKQYEIKASPAIKSAFSTVDDKGHKVPADALRFDPVTNTVTPIFYKPGQTGNKVEVTGDTKPMTLQEFKAVVGKTLFGAKEAVKESTNTQTGGSGIQWK